jgi:hypothetical protein
MRLSNTGLEVVQAQQGQVVETLQDGGVDCSVGERHEAAGPTAITQTATGRLQQVGLSRSRATPQVQDAFAAPFQAELEQRHRLLVGPLVITVEARPVGKPNVERKLYAHFAMAALRIRAERRRHASPATPAFPR